MFASIIVTSLFLYQMNTRTVEPITDTSESYTLSIPESVRNTLIQKVESASTENTMKACQQYTGDNGHWCVSFIVYLVNKSSSEYGLGNVLPITASSQSLYRWAVRKNCLMQEPKVGNIAIWKHNTKGGGHAGVVVDVWEDSFITIDGNITVDGNPDHGKVMIMYRNIYDKNDQLTLLGFIDMKKLYRYHIYRKRKA